MQCDKRVKNRLSRAEGQLRGINKMMDEGRDCSEILAQLTAVRSSIDRVIKLVGVNNLLDCVDQDNPEAIEDAVALLTKT